MKYDYYLKNIVTFIVAIIVMTACSSDDESSNGNSSSSAELIIEGKSYGGLPYACFMSNGDGTGSFMFSNQNFASGSIDRDSNLTYVSVRLPYTSGDIPTGAFSGSDVDADFDVNRILSSDNCELTGWSMDVTMSIQKSGNNYIVSVTSDNMHIYQSDDDWGNGTIGSLKMNYEGGIVFLDVQ